MLTPHVCLQRYDYNFPFINEKSKIELRCTPGERRVAPLYEQLWHARHPNLTFVGLPHSLLPFPAFEMQAEAVTAQFTADANSLALPPVAERMKAANDDELSGGPQEQKRVLDTHYLGEYQWDYCRRLMKFAGLYDENMEDYIATNKVGDAQLESRVTKFVVQT